MINSAALTSGAADAVTRRSGLRHMYGQPVGLLRLRLELLAEMVASASCSRYSRLAARLERSTFATQLYGGKRALSEGIGALYEGCGALPLSRRFKKTASWTDATGRQAAQNTKNGCKVWNPHPQNNELVVWCGACARGWWHLWLLVTRPRCSSLATWPIISSSRLLSGPPGRGWRCRYLIRGVAQCTVKVTLRHTSYFCVSLVISGQCLSTSRFRHGQHEQPTGPKP